MSELAFLS